MTPSRTARPNESDPIEKVKELLLEYELGLDMQAWASPEQFEERRRELFKEVSPEERDEFREVARPVGEGGVNYPEWAPNGEIVNELGQYTLKERLGRGGGGEVWRADDERLDRRVAIKRVDRNALAEAKGLSKVAHPNICALHGVDTKNSLIVMEFLGGGSLKDKKESNSLRIKWIAAIVCKVAEALKAVHEAGIIHRDIKPDNILFTSLEQGEIVKLSDFSHASAELLPKGGVSIGYAAYKAPEMRSGSSHSKLTGQADVFSLGVVLYELLTSSWPYGGGGYSESKDAPAAPHALNRCCPEVLSGLCLRMLEVEPEQRIKLKDPDERKPSVIQELRFIQRENSWRDHDAWTAGFGDNEDFNGFSQEQSSPLRAELSIKRGEGEHHWLVKERCYWEVKPQAEDAFARKSRGEDLGPVMKRDRRALRLKLPIFLEVNQDEELNQGAVALLEKVNKYRDVKDGENEREFSEHYSDVYKALAVRISSLDSREVGLEFFKEVEGKLKQLRSTKEGVSGGAALALAQNIFEHDGLQQYGEGDRELFERLARALLKVAAKNGDLEAQFQLGRRLLTGDGFPSDPATGIRHLQESKERRHKSARLSLERWEKRRKLWAQCAGASMAASLTLVLGSILSWWPALPGVLGGALVLVTFRWFAHLSGEMSALNTDSSALLKGGTGTKRDSKEMRKQRIVFRAYVEGLSAGKWKSFDEFKGKRPDHFVDLSANRILQLRRVANKSLLLNQLAIDKCGLTEKSSTDSEHRRVVEYLEPNQ